MRTLATHVSTVCLMRNSYRPSIAAKAMGTVSVLKEHRRGALYKFFLRQFKTAAGKKPGALIAAVSAMAFVFVCAAALTSTAENLQKSWPVCGSARLLTFALIFVRACAGGCLCACVHAEILFWKN